MSLHSWFHKNSKYLMAGMVVLLMISFGLPMTTMVRRNPRQGEILGEKVTLSDRYEPALALSVLRAIGVGMDPRFEAARNLRMGISSRVQYLSRIDYQIGQRLQELEDYDADSAEERTELLKGRAQLYQEFSLLEALVNSGRADVFTELYNFVFPQESVGNYPDWWRGLVLLREADQADIVVTDADLQLFKDFVTTCGNYGLLNPRYADVLKNANHTDESIDLGREALAKMFKLLELRASVTMTSTPEIWAPHYASSLSRTVDYVKLDAEYYVDDVVPSDSDLQAFYAQHSAQTMDPTGENPGYTTPLRAKLEVALVDMADVAASVHVSGEEAREYYEDPANADEFTVIPETAVDADEVEDAESEAEADAGDEAEEPAAAEDAEATADDEEATEEAGEETEPAKQAFGEVKNDIIAKLKESKVREEAERRVRVSAPRSASGWREKQLYPLRRIAADAGLSEPFVLGADEGKELLTLEEAIEMLPANGEGAVRTIYGEGSVPGETFEYAAGADTPFVLKLLEVQNPKILPLQDVRELVAKHWRPTGALDAAQERIDELVDTANESSMEEALVDLNQELEIPADSAIHMQTRDKITAGSYYAFPDAPYDIVSEIFDAEPDTWFTASPGTDAAFAVRAHEVSDAEEARLTREDFVSRYPTMRNQTLAGRRVVMLRNWLQALLDASEPDTAAIEQEEKEREKAREQEESAPAGTK